MNNNRYAPVAVFVYRRYDNACKCITTLSECVLAEETDLHIFADGYKNEKDRYDVERVQAWIRQFEATEKLKVKKCFRSVTLHIREKNIGLANSIISGVTEVFDKNDRIIVVEDDLVVSKGFLKYMNDGLNYYEDNDKIWSLTGHGYKLKSLRKYPHDVFTSYIPSSWGWASWKDRWKTVDWEVSDFLELEADCNKKRQFERGGKDFYPMLKRQMIGASDSWAIRWYYSASKQDKLSIHPKIGLVSNEGFGAAATHTVGSAPKHTISDGLNIKFENVELDPKITREIYYLNTDTIIKKIRRNASAKGIYRQIKRGAAFIRNKVRL